MSWGAAEFCRVYLAALVDAFIERSDGRKGGRPAYPTEVMVRILVLKRLVYLQKAGIEAF